MQRSIEILSIKNELHIEAISLKCCFFDLIAEKLLNAERQMWRSEIAETKEVQLFKSPLNSMFVIPKGIFEQISKKKVSRSI